MTSSRCVTRQHNLKLDLVKLQFKKKEASFFDTTFTPAGHKAEDDKVQTINKMAQTINVREIVSFFFFFFWYGQLPQQILFKIGRALDSLRKLTKKNALFVWGPEHTETFEAIKMETTNMPLLKYYHPSKSLTLLSDATVKDLGAYLLQKDYQIYFASKSLQPHQKDMCCK